VPLPTLTLFTDAAYKKLISVYAFSFVHGSFYLAGAEVTLLKIKQKKNILILNQTNAQDSNSNCIFSHYFLL